MGSEEKNSGRSVGTMTILQVVFLVLKLTGNIDWSWWWVMSPTLTPLLILLGASMGYITYKIIKKY